MANEIKAKKILLPALRQHQRNDCSGLIPAYDYEEANKIVAGVLTKLANSVENRVMPKLPRYTEAKLQTLLEDFETRLHEHYNGACTLIDEAVKDYEKEVECLKRLLSA